MRAPRLPRIACRRDEWPDPVPDPRDIFDPPGSVAAGIVLSLVLWVLAIVAALHLVALVWP